MISLLWFTPVLGLTDTLADLETIMELEKTREQLREQREAYDQQIAMQQASFLKTVAESKRQAELAQQAEKDALIARSQQLEILAKERQEQAQQLASACEALKRMEDKGQADQAVLASLAGPDQPGQLAEKDLIVIPAKWFEGV